MKISKIEIPKIAPETFEELCRLFLPRPIHDEAENAEMIRVMDGSLSVLRTVINSIFLR